MLEFKSFSLLIELYNLWDNSRTKKGDVSPFNGLYILAQAIINIHIVCGLGTLNLVVTL